MGKKRRLIDFEVRVALLLLLSQFLEDCLCLVWLVGLDRLFQCEEGLAERVHLLLVLGQVSSLVSLIFGFLGLELAGFHDGLVDLLEKSEVFFLLAGVANAALQLTEALVNRRHLLLERRVIFRCNSGESHRESRDERQ